MFEFFIVNIFKEIFYLGGGALLGASIGFAGFLMAALPMLFLKQCGLVHKNWVNGTMSNGGGSGLMYALL